MKEAEVKETSETILKYSLKVQTRDIIIEDDQGVETEYIMYELTGKGRDDHMADLSGRLRQKSGETRITNFQGIQANLVARCLKYKSDNKPVPEAQIQSWPARVVKDLYDMAQKMSGLDDTAEDKEKND